VLLTVFLEQKSSIENGPGAGEMSDVIFVAGTIVFFAVGVLYLKACERLK
jgi:hypothetical protein